MHNLEVRLKECNSHIYFTLGSLVFFNEASLMAYAKENGYTHISSEGLLN